MNNRSIRNANGKDSQASNDASARHSNNPQAIKNIQRYLRQLSFFDGDIPPVPVDGIYDSVTREALMAFQRKNGISPSGYADAETWRLLYEAYLLSVESNSPPLPLPIFPRMPDGYVMLIGANGFAVTAVQYILNEIAIINGGATEPPLEQTGVYDGATQDAVKSFQLQNGIDSTGSTDMQTWNTMVRIFESISSEYIQ